MVGDTSWDRLHCFNCGRCGDDSHNENDGSWQMKGAAKCRMNHSGGLNSQIWHEIDKSNPMTQCSSNECRYDTTSCG